MVLDIPKFEGDLEEIISSIVAWVDERVDRKQWSDEEIDEKFARRSARQILEEGHTGYMNPCLDLTLVAYEALRANDLNPTLVVQELSHEDYPHNQLHFGIEFTYRGELYFVDFLMMNRVFLRKGGYQMNKEGIKSLQIVRMDENVDTDKEPLSIGGEWFKPIGYRLEPQLERLKQDNTDETYEKYLAALGNKGNLYLDASI